LAFIHEKPSPCLTRIEKARAEVSPALYAFVEKEALPGSGVDPDTFWAGFAALAVKLMPQNRALLAERDRLQAAIDTWHKDHSGQADRPRPPTPLS